jgi:hypothetical protein
MKSTANSKSLLFGALLLMAGAHAAWASEPVGDAQQQARSLLGGRDVSQSRATPHTAVKYSAATATASNPVDAQDQARQMILGRPASLVRGAYATADSSVGATPNAAHTKAVRGSRGAEEGGDELARRMILGSAYPENTAGSMRRSHDSVR